MKETAFGSISGILGLVSLVIVAVTAMRTSMSPQLRNDWLIVAVVMAVVAMVLRIVQLAS